MQNDFKLKTHEGVVTFTPQKLESFRDAYEQCVGSDELVFEFEGHHYLKGYAKHMISYLEGLWVKDDNPKGGIS